MKKALFILLLTILLSFTFYSCGNEQAPETDNPSDGGQTPGEESTDGENSDGENSDGEYTTPVFPF